MKIIWMFIITGIISSFDLAGQEKNNILTDSLRNREFLYGEVDLHGLKGELFGDYFETEYDNYSSDPWIMNELSASGLGDFSYLLVFGSWCHDSHREVPRIYRIFDELGINTELIRVLGVDFDKQLTLPGFAGLNIKKVPTLIVFSEGKEIGRIVESPVSSIEKDLLEIISD